MSHNFLPIIKMPDAVFISLSHWFIDFEAEVELPWMSVRPAKTKMFLQLGSSV